MGGSCSGRHAKRTSHNFSTMQHLPGPSKGCPMNYPTLPIGFHWAPLGGSWYTNTQTPPLQGKQHHLAGSNPTAGQLATRCATSHKTVTFGEPSIHPASPIPTSPRRTDTVARRHRPSGSRPASRYVRARRTSVPCGRCHSFSCSSSSSPWTAERTELSITVFTESWGRWGRSSQKAAPGSLVIPFLAVVYMSQFRSIITIHTFVSLTKAQKFVSIGPEVRE